MFGFSNANETRTLQWHGSCLGSQSLTLSSNNDYPFFEFYSLLRSLMQSTRSYSLPFETSQNAKPEALIDLSHFDMHICMIVVK